MCFDLKNLFSSSISRNVTLSCTQLVTSIRKLVEMRSESKLFASLLRMGAMFHNLTSRLTLLSLFLFLFSFKREFLNSLSYSQQQNWTSVHYAAYRRNVEIIKILLDHFTLKLDQDFGEVHYSLLKKPLSQKLEFLIFQK